MLCVGFGPRNLIETATSAGRGRGWGVVICKRPPTTDNAKFGSVCVVREKHLPNASFSQAFQNYHGRMSSTASGPVCWPSITMGTC